MEYSYKFRLYPNAGQQQLILRTCGCRRFVYNHFLAERIALYKEEGRSIGRFEQDKELTQLKQELEWLQEPDKCALQNALRDLDVAFKNFFSGCKSGKRIGFPRFKSKKDRRQSYRTSSNIKVFETAIQLPKLGRVKCRVSKQVQGRILSATVSVTPGGKYFVSLCCTGVEIKTLPKTGASVGVDLGLKDLAICSDGTKYPNHKHLRQSERRLARLQRQLSRKTKGSKRREKARIKVARLHEKVANQRSDMLHKLSTQLVRDYDFIAMEDLAPGNMVRNHSLARSISDAAWGEFRRQLEYKAAWYGKEVLRVDRFFPSSQLCSVCGECWGGTKDLNVREWDCPHCGAHLDRDVNAAINILAEGLKKKAAA